jgi:hypothetical protein
MTEPIFLIRPGRADDFGFISENWLMSNGRSSAAQHAPRVYLRRHRELISSILARPTTAIHVAHVTGEPSALLGFAITNPSAKAIYYVYTKKDAWRMGIAKALLGPLAHERNLIFTHKPTITGLKLPADWIFDPYANWTLP